MRIAVVIAANGPEGSADRLKFAEHDGLRIADALERAICGYQVLRVPGDTVASEVRRIVLEAAEGCGPDDAFLCYFAGHGRAHNGALLLQLNLFREDRPIATSLAASDLLLAARACKSRNRALIVDCCNAGQLAREQGVRSGGTPVKELGMVSDTFDIVMASGFLEFAFEREELEGGFLTSAIVEALSTKLAEADADGDGALSFDDIMRWLERRADEVNASRGTKPEVPVPQRLGFGRGVSYLTRPPREWIVHEIRLPDSSQAVVLPIGPVAIHGHQCAFVMSRHAVTNRYYKYFVRKSKSESPKGLRYDQGKGWHGPYSPWEDPNFSDPDQPVVCVTAEDALEYCRFFQVSPDTRCPGLLALLPPLPEMWSVAVFNKVYENLDPKTWMSISRVVHHLSSAPAKCTNAPERTSALGLTDLIGNTWEWCGSKSDWMTALMPQFRERVFLGVRELVQGTVSMGDHREPPVFENVYQQSRHELEDFYTASEVQEMQRRAIRGGSFLDDLWHVSPVLDAQELEQKQETSHNDLGFRLAAAVELSSLPSEVVDRLIGCPLLPVERPNSERGVKP